jgi:(1->4)-alpha-D-glucan 1-alpha-D-glucosylmutase
MDDVRQLEANGGQAAVDDAAEAQAAERAAAEARAARLADEARPIAARVVDEVRHRYVRPIATYRLQFNPAFTFRDAAALVPYLKRLGISHVYASPYLRPKQGSTSGYNVCDPSQLNPELGGDETFAEWLDAMRAHGMSQILDIVPNHMAAVTENPWWFDVLENGPSSPFANFFDIDWDPIKPELAGKVLLPVLGQQYGEVLEDGQLKLDYHEGAFSLSYYDLRLPTAAKSTLPLLNHRLDDLRAALGEEHEAFIELQSIMTSIEHLPPQTARDLPSIRERQREIGVIKRRLRELTAASEPTREHIQRNVVEYNGQAGEPNSFDLLDDLIKRQAYRLCHWRASFDEVNYRRFFDINELAAINAEIPEVFWRTHERIRKLLTERAIEGLRIDHIDGLFDPDQYLWRLQWSYLGDLAQQFDACAPSNGEHLDAAAAEQRAADWRQRTANVLQLCCDELLLPAPDDEDLLAILGPETPQASQPGVHAAYERAGGELPLYVVVEKILGPDEPLPDRWPVAGTSGYDFLSTLNGLFVSPTGLQDLSRTYDRFIGEHVELEKVVRDSKMLILRVSMASELQMLAHQLNRISEQHRRTRDFTLNMLRYALREVLTCFPVYRIYPHKDGVEDRDRRFVDVALAKAKRRNPAWDPAVFEFLRQVLLLQHPPGLSAEAIRERELFAGRFQQVTSPVMAKGVEDTTFYVHVPLASINEVGGDAKQPCTSIAAFHRQNEHRQDHYRQALLATSTHDTKRSEDLRARLNVLSEVPGEWRRAVQRWSRLNRRLRHEVDGEAAPSRNDEYLFYQALLGVWPLEQPDAERREQLIARLQRYMEKATREAKQRTSWINPNPAYDAAVQDFIARALAPGDRNRFLQHFHEFSRNITHVGFYNGLSQTALKLLSPGVPDIYQGQEIWNFSLVDPDNRRPVDYVRRALLLDELDGWANLAPDGRRANVERLGRSPHEPLAKLLVTRRLLELRRRRAQLWLSGQCVPVEVDGPRADHVVAFGWRAEESSPLEILAVVPRFVYGLVHSPDGDAAAWWGDTRLALPAGGAALRDVFTEAEITLQPETPVAALLTHFPLAVLGNL